MAENAFEERKARLSPLEYQVVVNKVTERPFSNKYNRHFEPGVYNCVVCNQELFKSETKFESKSGWPAFTNVVHNDRVKLKNDTSHVGMNLLLLASRPDLVRTEVSCSSCGAHLGHLFKDGPKPLGLRYCINSSSLSFIPASEKNRPETSENACKSLPPPPKSCSSDKICFFSSSTGNNDRKVDLGIQRISSKPQPPILRETTL